MRARMRLAVGLALLAAPVAAVPAQARSIRGARLALEQPGPDAGAGGDELKPRLPPGFERRFWLDGMNQATSEATKRFRAARDNAAAALNKSKASIEGSRDQIWHQMGALEEESHLWSYQARVLVVIGLFFVFEYCFDIIAWVSCGMLKNGPEVSKHRLNAQAGRMHREHDEPGVLARLKVLTLNVYVNEVRENLDVQLKGIRELAPDVICLQEVFHLDVLDAYRSAFHDYTLVAFGRAHNASALIAVVALLILFASIISGAVWLVETFVSDKRWRSVWTLAVPVILVIYVRLIRHHWTIAFLTGNRTGLAMLVRSDTIDIKEKHCVKFSRAGHAADLLNFLRPRGFLNVSGIVRLPGHYKPLPIRMLTTHLNQPLEQALGDGRHRQVKEVFQKCLHSGEFLVLGCDLNATPPGTLCGSDCNTYADVAAELNDAWATSNPSDPSRDGLTWDPDCNGLLKRNGGLGAYCNEVFYGLTHRVSSIRWRCDYVFWRQDQSAAPALAEDDRKKVAVSLRSCTMVFTGDQAVSDHYGVIASFDVRAD